jgi:hypothetical protein
MWVQKLGGCPSYDDLFAFGTNLDHPKLGGARYVGGKACVDEITKNTSLTIGEFSKSTDENNGRQIDINQARDSVHFYTALNARKTNGRVMIVNLKEGSVFVGTHKLNNKCA